MYLESKVTPFVIIKLKMFLHYRVISILSHSNKNEKCNNHTVVHVLVWWWMKGRVAFSPSLTFVLHGVLLPVGPRHVKAQGADWQGLSGTDKMDWKSGFPPLSSSDKHITSAFINGGKENNQRSQLLWPAPEEFFSLVVLFFFLILKQISWTNFILSSGLQ